MRSKLQPIKSDVMSLLYILWVIKRGRKYCDKAKPNMYISCTLPKHITILWCECCYVEEYATLPVVLWCPHSLLESTALGLAGHLQFLFANRCLKLNWIFMELFTGSFDCTFMECILLKLFRCWPVCRPSPSVCRPNSVDNQLVFMNIPAWIYLIFGAIYKIQKDISTFLWYTAKPNTISYKTAESGIA